MFSDMPFMYGIVAVVTGVALLLASVVVVGLSVTLNEIFVVVVLMSSFYSSDFHSSNYCKDLVVHMYCVWNTFKPGNFITKRSKVN